MNTNEIQARIDRMPAALNVKGRREPEVMYWINANSHSQVVIQWKNSKADSWGSKVDFNVIRGETVEELLDNADAFIAAMPSPEAARMAEFTEALAGVIELGRQNGIDVEFVNPLTEAMKRLSENALTHQAATE